MKRCKGLMLINKAGSLTIIEMLIFTCIASEVLYLEVNLKFYIKFFLHTFKLSALTFGGGYVIVPLMRKQFVDELGLIDEKEMLNLTAMAQSTPGALAVNASVLLGYNLAGILGALTAVLGTILPPLILISIISIGYSSFANNLLVKNLLKGMQIGVCAVIIDVIIDMAGSIIKNKKIVSICIMIFSFISVTVLKVNIIYVLIISGLIGFLYSEREAERETTDVIH
jgi:chromate transporter